MTLHLVSHTHWDREWFLPSRYTREWLPPFFEALFALLARRPEYRFTLDGQTILIEDYCAQLEHDLRHGAIPSSRTVRDPEAARHLLQQHVRAGRIAVGPYYLQPDWNLVSGEALVRNLQIGRRDARAFGEPMRAGWILDNFGQIGQCPQIHCGFGLFDLVFWRGLDLAPQELQTELTWKSPDGSAVSAVYMIDSYRNAMQLLAHPEILIERLRYAAERGARFSAGGHVLLMNGYDQEMNPEDVIPALERARAEGFDIRQGRPEEFFSAVRSAGATDSSPGSSFPTIRGEQYNGRYISVFPGVLSARVYLKQANHRAETLLERYLEPIAVHAALHGRPFPEHELTELWRELLRNHPHDSICGVSVDDVHTDMEARYARIGAGAEALLCDCIGHTGPESEPSLLTVFNPLPEPRSEILIVNAPAQHRPERCPTATELSGRPVTCSRLTSGRLALSIEDIPPTGFKIVKLSTDHEHANTSDTKAPDAPKASDRSTATARAEQHAETATLENAYLRATVHGNGTVDLRNKQSGTEYHGLLCYEDRGDVGDTYSYCSPSDDQLVLSADAESTTLEVIEPGPLLGRCRITQVMRLPAAANSPRNGRDATTVEVPVVTELTLAATDTALQARVHLRNRARDHRLRVLFPVPAERVAAGSPYDTVERPAVPRPYHDGEIPPHLKEMLLGAREPDPITTLPFRSFVAAEGAVCGLAILTRGLYEYEYTTDSEYTARAALESGAIALTLLRSVGWLARGDLTSRTGDAGPLIATPDAQCLRDLVFEFALFPYEGSWQNAGVAAHADRFAAPPLVAPLPTPGFVPQAAPDDAGAVDPMRDQLSNLIELQSPNSAVRLSTLTLSEHREAITLRVHNPSPSPTQAHVIAGFPVSRATQTNLAENPTRSLPIADNALTLEIGAHEVLTLLLYPEGRLGSSLNASEHESAQTGADAFPTSGRRADLNITGVLPVTEPLEPAADTATAGTLSAYQPVPAVENTDIAAERERLAELRNTLEQRRTALEAARRDLPAEQELDARIQGLEAAVSTTERTMLEAEISVRMLELKTQQQAAGMRLPGAHDEQSRELFRSVGYRLNQARIKKRTDDYLCDLLKPEPDQDEN